MEAARTFIVFPWRLDLSLKRSSSRERKTLHRFSLAPAFALACLRVFACFRANPAPVCTESEGLCLARASPPSALSRGPAGEGESPNRAAALLSAGITDLV
jgi:hypothetical protein